MENLDQDQMLLLLAAVAAGAFILGRMSRSGAASAGAAFEPRQERSPQEVFALLTPDQQARVDELLRARKKIEAIRFVRERTGCGLKEAKDAVEQGRGPARA